MGSSSKQSFVNGELKLWRFLHDKHVARVTVDVGVKDSSTLVESLTPEERDACQFELVEASPIFCENLRAKYAVMSNVCIHGVAAGEEADGFVKYHPSTESIALRDVTKPKGYDDPIIEVPCRRLDDLITQAVDFIKVDVEGHELSVLRGASRLLHDVSFVQFEYGGTYLDAKVTVASVVALLRSHGLTHLYAIEATGLNVVKEPPEDYLYKNYLASRCSL